MAKFLEYSGNQSNIENFKKCALYVLNGGNNPNKIVFSITELIQYLESDHTCSWISGCNNSGNMLYTANMELNFDENSNFSSFKIIVQ